MQIRKSRLLFLAFILGSAAFWYFGGTASLEVKLAALANQPHVNTAFQDPNTGQSDALLTLICAALLVPMAAFAAFIVGLCLVRGVEAVVVSLRGPGWFSLPLVGTSLIAGLYMSSPLWVPTSLYGLGMVARAYFVYSYGPMFIVR
ncbi:MAG TPA: hypothetical protein VGL14_17075 [Methylomirabilota bacterium]|jgi:hypothetical protein